jgi:aspartyl-tRNA(Asn)/glutamyl-tRNA(Gln) amidotransferase subunit B
VDPGQLAELVRLVADGSINRGSAREVLEAHVSNGETVEAIIARLGLRQISDSGALGPVIDEVLAANPAAVGDYRAGKPQAVGFLVGQVMKATRGQANAKVAQDALRARLDEVAKAG